MILKYKMSLSDLSNTPAMSLFQYLGAIFSVRNSSSSVIIDNRSIKATDTKIVHQLLLSVLNSHGIHKNVLICEDEFILTRTLGDINDNEIKTLLTTDTVPWDILILSPYKNTDLQPVEGYSKIKTSSMTALDTKYVYIASSSFMIKAAKNNLTNLNVLVYTDPFIDSLTKKKTSDEYIVSQVTSIKFLKPGQTQYHWKEFTI